MPTIPLVPGPPPPGNFGQTIVLAPPPTAADPCPTCVCADLSVAWFNSSQSATVIVNDTTFPAFAISGTICPATTYDVSTEWDPDAAGTEPINYSFGNDAWAVVPSATGILSLTVTVHCEGVDTVLDPVVLTIISDGYGYGCAAAPTEYTNIQSFFTDSCIVPLPLDDGVFSIPAAEFYSWDGDVFTVNRPGDFPNVPEYIGTAASGVWLIFTGLEAMFGAASMDVRITVTADTMDNSTAHGLYIDDHTGSVVTDFAPYSWERTVADVSTFFTGAGVGDGAGSLGSCSFRIEIRLTP